MTKFAFGEKWCNKKWPAARNNQLKTKRRTERANVVPYKPLYAARIFCWVVGAIFVLAYKYVFMCVKKWGIKGEFFIPPFGKKYEQQKNKRWGLRIHLLSALKRTDSRQTDSRKIYAPKSSKRKSTEAPKVWCACVCVSSGGRATGLRNTHTERESKNFQRQKLLSL